MAFNNSATASRISIDLSGLIASHTVAINAVVGRERALKESKFQDLVTQEGLSYEAQLEYRKDQIASEEKKAKPDKEYISTLKSSIASVRKLKKFRDIRNDYMKSYDDLQMGKISNQTHLSFLENTLANETDEGARSELQKEISSMRSQIAQSDIDTLKNRVSLAQQDGTIALISSTIDDVVKKKAKAELAGNSEESSMWDLSINSLKQKLNETKTENSIHDIDYKVSKAGSGAMQKLDILASEIANADDSTPVTISGRKYESAKQFWSTQRDNYVNGIGSNPMFSNFFNDLESEIKNKVDAASSINTYNSVPTSTLDAVSSSYDSLLSRPEFSALQDRVASAKIGALSYGVEKASQAIISSSTDTLLAEQGTKQLESLEQKYKIDLASAKSDLSMSVLSRGSSLESMSKAGDVIKKVGGEAPRESLPDKTAPVEVAKSNIQPESVIPPKPAPTPVSTPPAQEPTVAPKLGSSKGFVSVTDYLKAQNQDNSFSARSKLYEQHGLGKATEYQGTADQNVALLDKFRT